MKLGIVYNVLLTVQTVTDRQMQDDHRRGQFMLHVKRTGAPHRLYRRLIQRFMSGSFQSSSTSFNCPS